MHSGARISAARRPSPMHSAPADLVEPPDWAEVSVNVYDIAPEGAASTVRALNSVALFSLSLGLFHAGVQVSDVEHGYGWRRAGSGVYSCRPRGAPGAAFRRSVASGRTPLGRGEREAILRALAAEWHGASYDAFSRNCVHFCEELCARLLVKPPPAWCNLLATSLAPCLADAPAERPGPSPRAERSPRPARRAGSEGASTARRRAGDARVRRAASFPSRYRAVSGAAARELDAQLQRERARSAALAREVEAYREGAPSPVRVAASGARGARDSGDDEPARGDDDQAGAAFATGCRSASRASKPRPLGLFEFLMCSAPTTVD